MILVLVSLKGPQRIKLLITIRASTVYTNMSRLYMPLQSTKMTGNVITFKAIPFGSIAIVILFTYL